MKVSPSSVHLVDSMGSDLSVVNAARVSFAKESSLSNGVLQESDIKLINYLAKHSHWSPFAHNSLTFRIKAPIFVARQLVKHQVGGVWNEESRRYIDEEPEFYWPTKWRGKPINVKQGSSDVIDWQIDPKTIVIALETYKSAIEHGVAPEQARMVLPQNVMTNWWWTGSLMFFARVCKQRLDPHAQKETRDIAQMINDAIPKEFEHSWKALML
jgi:thymidylate synthase (FAD)